MKKEKPIDGLIDKQVSKAAKNQSSIVHQVNKDLKGDVALNQAQVHNIIEELYGVTEKSTIDASKIDKKKKSTVPEPAPAQGDYADYYQRVKMMAKDKGMSDEEMQKLLKDRQKGEEAYKKVSGFRYQILFPENRHFCPCDSILRISSCFWIVFEYL